MSLDKAIRIIRGIKSKIFDQRRCISSDVFNNLHLQANTAKLTCINTNSQAYLRPSFSDKARVAEYKENIYLPACTLTDALKEYKPNVLLDIGANIGLSSLALAESIPTLKKVIGIEAERENFGVLQRNYKIWTEKLNIDFESVFGVATEVEYNAIKASSLPGGVSASGTFMFANSNSENSDPICGSIIFGPSIKVSDILRQLQPSDKLIVKVDIEGGEQFLFDTSESWLERAAFLSIELHDRFGLPHSSRSILSHLASNDFAIYPREDTLHCYNRKLLAL